MPSSTTLPRSITSTRSAEAAVVRRWATTSVVRGAAEQLGRPGHLGFGVQVERCRRLVEQQDLRFDELGPRQRDELALPR